MRCLLCGNESDNGKNVCSRCERDYEITNEQMNNFNSGISDNGIDKKSQESTKGTVAIVSAFFIPLLGFVLGIIYASTLEEKTKPAIAIVVSVLVMIFNISFLLQYVH